MRKLVILLMLICGSVFASSQTCAPPNYCAYRGTDIVLPSSIPPNLGGLDNNLAIVYDTSYVSHGQSPTSLGRTSRCTDRNFTPAGGLVGFSAGQGGSGSATLWNTNSSLVHIVGNGGASLISLFNPSTMRCSTAITQDKNLTHPGSASISASFGSGEFSRTNPNLWWAFGVVGTDVTSRTAVTPFTINTSTGTYTIGSTELDFKYGLPLGSNAPEWTASTSYNLGAYVTHTAVPGEFFTYQSNYSGFHLGDIIWPAYPAGCGFVLKTLGTTGATPPNWTTAANCGSNATPIPDGTAAWRSLAGPAAFVFQLISATGTSGSSTPAFVPVSTKHPDILSTVSDNGLTWENVGVNTTSAMWGSLTKVSPDGTKFAKSFSTNTYGADPSSLGGFSNICTYANCSADQGTGILALAYDSITDVYNLFNIGTNIQTAISCSGGSGFSCTGGTRVFTTVGKTTSPVCPFYLHDSDGTADALEVVLTIQADYLGSSCPTSTPLVWNPYQSFDATTQVRPLRTAINHPAYGFSHIVQVGGQNTLNYGFSTGAYGTIYPLNDVASKPPIFWQAVPCDISSVWVPGDSIQPCQTQVDDHLSWAYNPGDDSTPVCSTYYNQSLPNANGPFPVAPYQGEIVCVSISPTWTDTNTPDPTQKQWRFGHTNGTQSNTNFNIQFLVGQLSQDGKYYAYGTDWGAQFGSSTGVPPVLPIANPSVTCLGGYLWQKNFAYTLGTVINPVPSLNGGGAPFDAYQAIAVTGNSGSTAPNWALTDGSIGAQFVDNGITWQDLGPGTCRGEVVIVELSTFSSTVFSKNSAILN